MSSEDWEEAARCFYNQDWKGLIEINEAKLKDDPNSEFLLWETADAYFNLGDYKKALEIGKRIRELYPDSPNAEDIIERSKAMIEKNVKQEEITVATTLRRKKTRKSWHKPRNK